MDRKVAQGVLAEISMRAKLLRARLKDDPSAVEEVLSKIEALEDELLSLFRVFVDDART